MQLKNADNIDLRRLKRLYKEAFPARERKPFAMLRRLQKAGRIEMLAAANDGDFCGLAITAFWRDVVLLDYLAVEPKLRDRGLGGELLAALAARYPGRRLLVEIERPGAPGTNLADCLRRRAFYLQNGFRETGVAVGVYQSEFLLLLDRGGFSFAEYRELYQQLFGRQIVRILNIRQIS